MKKKVLYLFYAILVANFFIKCNDAPKIAEGQEPKTEQLFQLLDSTQTGINFLNTITETEDFNFLLYEYLYNGGGVAIGDINNDGLDDIYFSGNMVINKLYLNLGDFKFKDITETAGVNGGLGFKTGVTMADVNNDGFLDIYVCKSAFNEFELRRNVLYINNGNETFTDKSKEYGLDDPSFSSQAYFFDMDNDNDLDVYLVNHPNNLWESNNINLVKDADGKLVVAKPQSYDYISGRIYKNDNNKFSDITEKAGMLNEAFGLSAVVSDFNADGFQDIYVCNDYIRPDNLYINQRNNTFKDEFETYFRHSSFSSMGSDFADINNDGCLDLITLDMLPRDNYRQKMMGMAQNYDKFQKMVDYGLQPQYSANSLQLNSCEGNFSDIALMANIATTDWSWSALLADFDNDGYKDLFVSNGYLRDITNNDYARYTMDSLQKKLNAKEIKLMDWLKAIPSNKVPSFFFRNTGELSYEDVSNTWNSGGPAFSSGAAYGDLNNDGFLDVVVNNIGESPFIMKNKGSQNLKNHFLKVQFEHNPNEVFLGTTAKAYLNDGSVLTEQYNPTRGFLSSSQHALHFGIAENKKIVKLEIIWPDGKTQFTENPKPNETLRIAKNPTSIFEKSRHEVYFEAVSGKNPLIKHTENDYIDFKREPLLHHKYSQEGPAASVTDVNGDGLEDLFIGGAMGFPSQLYLQDRGGKFVLKKIPGFESDKEFEDVASHFFDANGDGFMDLYVVSGGNERLKDSPFYQDRIYFNDGKGNFSKAVDALPQMLTSGGMVASHDIDGDGDLDLFIGGRVTPGRYPETPKSYLLRNDNGKYTNITAQWSKGLENLGMITDAVFADLDKDKNFELIVSGEWMPISVFKMENKKYKNVTTEMGLNQNLGWWYSLKVADMNNDGFPEIIAGNLGLNSLIKANEKKPASLWYSDFDNNGTVDPVLLYYNTDQSYPLHFRDRIQDQMIMLKKKFTRHQQFANATITDIFTEDQLKNATELKANTFEHSIFINNKGMNFSQKTLPVYSQISVVKSIEVMDVNNDGALDMLLGGNLYGTDAQIGRYDASIGLLLLGDNAFGFKAVPPSESGFVIPGNVRHVLPLKLQGEPHYWIVRNNQASSFLKILRPAKESLQ